MNRFHHRYCRSARWRRHLSGLMPWALEGLDLQDCRVVELGSGPGLTTDWLGEQTDQLTAVEYDGQEAAALARRCGTVRVLHADARAVPLPDGVADIVVCFTMLHHLPSAQAQDELFVEAHRLLSPGGVFAGSDNRGGPLFALAHLHDTMTVVAPAQLPDRLSRSGFNDAAVATRFSAFRFRGIRGS